MNQVSELGAANDKQTILVVDDVPANVRLLRAYLSSVGYEVVSASGGQEALESMRDQIFDLVLLDVMMPQVNGFDVCMSIKRDTRTQHVPVILVTSLNDIEDKVRGQQAGADDFVSKPFNKLELLVRVKSMLRVKNLSDQLNTKIGELEETKLELRRLANTDDLTSMHNRRYFEEFLERELTRAERYRRKLSLVMLDIDHFKRFNDTLGHQAGDRLLQEMARLFVDSIRSIDIAARVGGEEFAMVLLETDMPEAGVVAEKLRDAVASRDFLSDREMRDGHVTVSMGVSTYPDDGASLMKLIEVADRRLYLAKQRGRDRVVSGADE